MKRARAYWIALLSFLLQLALAFTPLYPATQGWWRVDNSEDFYAVLATFIGVDIALVSLVFAMLFLHESGNFREEVKALVERVPASTIRWLPDQAFYRAFLAAAAEARSTVRIAYFAPVPPDTVSAPGRARYYSDMAELMKHRHEVQFFRLVRYSSKNHVWILELIREFSGASNVSVAAITADLGPEQSMPLALSVQIIDDERSWLVAIESHERIGAHRDVYVENAVFGDAMTRYYNRLWDVAVPLLDHGQPTRDARALTLGPDPGEELR